MISKLQFTVARAGIRLDRYLVQECPEVSRSYIQKLISEGYITVNNRVVKRSFKLDSGDKVSAIIPESISPPLAEATPLNIVYEDNDLLVLDKPPGLVVHPTTSRPNHTLVNAILAHCPHLASMDSARPGIVHRLDKNTSGLMVVAKSEAAQQDLSAQIKSRSVVKRYLVLAAGHLSPDRGIIEAPIGRHLRNRKRMAVVSGGKEARTQYRVIRYLDDFTLLEVTLETGRTHQIRVHLEAIGYPVVGDSIYGVKSDHLSRQFLHACRLGFKLPSTGEYVEFTSELPSDLTQVLKAIG
ncbi:RluA family pseudouridine synthase [Chloroflexota bacterium]